MEGISKSKYKSNFDGSSGSMEPLGLVQLFKNSLDYKLRYKHFVSDEDSSTLASLMKEKPYGEDCEIVKEDCIGHIQKRMGSALHRLVVEYKGKFLSDSKKISGTGRLTKKVIDKLQNYYGMAIRSNVGDLRGMMMAVQATLHHMTSTDDRPVHHMCPEGENFWCSYNKAKARNKLDEYKHGFDAIPQAIVQLLKPIYNRLGSRLLLSKCLLGYTLNANESLHSKVWRFCPKRLFFFKPRLVKIGCALAICTWNDGCSSLHGLAQKLELQPTLSSLHVLQAQDLEQLSRSVYKESS